jgi:hypothetical protein
MTCFYIIGEGSVEDFSGLFGWPPDAAAVVMVEDGGRMLHLRHTLL